MKSTLRSFGSATSNKGSVLNTPQKLKPHRKVNWKNKPRPARYITKPTNGGCDAICSEESVSRARKAVSNTQVQDEYYTFVVDLESGNGYLETRPVWVNVCGDTLNCCGSIPMLWRTKDLPKMHDVWRRAVIDGAIPWNDRGVRKETLRIVSYKLAVVDVTEVMIDDDERQHLREMSAVAKLSNEDAKLLGLDLLKAKQVLLSDSEFRHQDARLMRDLGQEQEELRVETFVVNPHPSKD